MQSKLSALSESALELQFDAPVSHKLLDRIQAITTFLNSHDSLRAMGLTDTVPAYQRILFHFSHRGATLEKRMQLIEELIPLSPAESVNASRHEIAVSYMGTDLMRVAKHCGLSTEQVIKRHLAPSYRVAMIGFLPNFPYLFGMDPALETPRLANPRQTLPAGSVAIGGAQTGIYPSASPGGWNLIGRTDPAILTSLNMGDWVQLVRADEN